MDKTTKIIVVFAVLAVIGVIAWYVYSKKSTKTEEKKETTTTNNSSEKSTGAKVLNLGGDLLNTVGNSDLMA